MAEVPSTFRLVRGASAPAFELPDSSGGNVSLSGLLEGRRGLLVAFVCNHCPFVIHLAKELGALAKAIGSEEIATVAISANDIERYPADSPQNMVRFAEESGWAFPYLYDATQEVAKAYAAACTPDFYLFNAEGALVYAGQFDETRPGSGERPHGGDLRRAVDCLLAGQAVPEPWYPSSGCNIKWLPGKEPDYFPLA